MIMIMQASAILIDITAAICIQRGARCRTAADALHCPKRFIVMPGVHVEHIEPDKVHWAQPASHAYAYPADTK